MQAKQALTMVRAARHKGIRLDLGMTLRFVQAREAWHAARTVRAAASIRADKVARVWANEKRGGGTLAHTVSRACERRASEALDAYVCAKLALESAAKRI